MKLYSSASFGASIISRERKHCLELHSLSLNFNIFECVLLKISFNIIGAFPPKIKRKTGSVLVIPTNHNQTVNIGQIAMVFEGRSLIIHCPVKGIPKPAVSWKFEGKDIRQISGVNVMVDKSGGGLMIVEVNKLIAGKVSCVAENVLGSSSASSLIKIQGKSLMKCLLLCFCSLLLPVIPVSHDPFNAMPLPVIWHSSHSFSTIIFFLFQPRLSQRLL